MQVLLLWRSFSDVHASLSRFLAVASLMPNVHASLLCSNRRSFTCDYLLTADIEVSGSNFKLATGGTEEHHLDRKKQLRTPFDLLLRLFKEAADSGG